MKSPGESGHQNLIELYANWSKVSISGPLDVGKFNLQKSYKAKTLENLEEIKAIRTASVCEDHMPRTCRRVRGV